MIYGYVYYTSTTHTIEVLHADICNICVVHVQYNVHLVHFSWTHMSTCKVYKILICFSNPSQIGLECIGEAAGVADNP